MADKKYTLPRHTNLAKHGYRLVAAIFDLVCTIIITSVFAIGTFIGAINITSNERSLMREYRFNSGLCYMNENILDQYEKSDFEDYRSYDYVLRYYYLHYLVGDTTKMEIPNDVEVYLPEEYKIAPNVDETWTEDGKEIHAKDKFTISWYNENILGIGEDPDAEKSTSLFTYQKNEASEYDLEKIGIPREKRFNESTGEQIDITPKDLKGALFTQYQTAYNHLMFSNYYYSLNTKTNFFTSLAFYIAALLGTALVYILIPIIRKDGATLGKMIFKLGLANIYGYKHQRYQVLMRYIPLFLTLTALSFIPFVTEYILVLIGLIILLVSFALMMASPKRTALHDLTGQTIVIETNTSKIFETRADEIAFSMLEDENYINEE